MGSNKPSTTRRRSIPADWTTKLVKWSQTPQDILQEISNQIDSIEDYVSFCRVCTSWRSAAATATAKENFNQSPHIKLPWLMHEITNYPKETVRLFFSVSTGKLVHRTVLRKYRAGFPYLPYFESLGWLFVVPYHEDARVPIYLEHPISGVTFDIPNVIGNVDAGLYEHISYNLINKVVLSTHKITNPNFSVIITIHHGSSMCLWRPGAKAWVKLHHQDISSFADIAYHKDQLYVVSSQTIYRCKIEGSRLIVTGKFVATIPKEYAWTPYLVEPSSMDSLLVVYREETDVTHYRIAKFYVFEVDLRNGTVEEVNSLGDRAIFCGVETCRFSVWHHRRGATTLVKASEDRGIKANCIYFKCCSVEYVPFDCVDVSDIGLYYYNLEDRRFHACTPGLSGASGNKNGRRPSISLVTPTFN